MTWGVAFGLSLILSIPKIQSGSESPPPVLLTRSHVRITVCASVAGRGPGLNRVLAVLKRDFNRNLFPWERQLLFLTLNNVILVQQA
jgi:hypothetical protein